MNIADLRKYTDPMLSPVYARRGMKPWTLGYTAYKRKLIERYIRERIFSPERLPEGYGYRVDERIIEYPWLFSRLDETYQIVLDAGSVLNYDYLLHIKPLSSKRLFISTLAPERRNYVHKGVSYVFEDLRNSCFRDEYFDAIVSLSTIEHIGLDNTLHYTNDADKKEANPQGFLAAIQEYYRMLRSGGKLYLSFPFGRHRVHSWYQVFDQAMVNSILDIFDPVGYHVNYFYYHSDGWQVATADECNDAETFDIHTMKEYMPDFTAFSQAVCCMELIK